MTHEATTAPRNRIDSTRELPDLRRCSGPPGGPPSSSRVSAALLAPALLFLATGAARAEEPPAPAPSAELKATAPPTNRGIAYLEVLGVNLTLNLGGRIFKPEEDTFDVTWESWKANLSAEWVYDPNSFLTNQFAHPYQGSLFMTSCRSNGLGFWESSLCTGVGSWIWELFMEIHPPSINDQITTTVGGTFLGEVLHRLSNELHYGAGDRPTGGREFAAFAVSPMTGLNRRLYGDRYRDRRLDGYPSSHELSFMLSLSGEAQDAGEDAQLEGGSVRLNLRMTHGLPTAEGWRFRRPFDHFDISAGINIDHNTFTDASGGNLLIRGLLAGDDLGEGLTSGLWGLWGVYDVITAAQIRASTSALAVGLVNQWVPSPRTRVQATAYLGAGYGAAGTSAIVEDQRDYHLGAQGVGLLDLRVLYANRIRIRASLREYVTSDRLSPDEGGFEDLTYALGDVSFRIRGGHTLGLELLGGRRWATYPDIPDVSQRFHQLSVTYSFVTEPSMGAGRLILP